MVKSTHRVEVVSVKLEPHENANTLSIIHIFGYSVVVRTKDWSGIDRGAYIVPDSLVPVDNKSFSFLDDGKRLYEVLSDGTAKRSTTGRYARITAIRLRGVLSYGLLVPAPVSELGANLAEEFGVVRYEPVTSASTGGETEKPPSVHAPHYDVDSLRRYVDKFKPGERITASEKIHGACGRWVYTEDGEGNLRMYAGSRKEWKRPDSDNLWWKALANTPGVEEFCREHPGLIVYGEAYGQVQNLKYGKGSVHIAVFDIMELGEWLHVNAARHIGESMPWVPLILHNEPFDMDRLLKLSTGPSLIEGASNIREGIVIKPMEERRDDEIGRVQLKLISEEYLRKK